MANGSVGFSVDSPRAPPVKAASRPQGEALTGGASGGKNINVWFCQEKYNQWFTR